MDDLAALRPETAPAKPAAVARRPRAFRWPGFALAAASAVLLGGFFWMRQIAPADVVARHVTQIGERRQIPLPDGSTLQLNTASAVEVAFSARERRVRLEQGEVFATVTADPGRPFVVTVEGVEARAVGTAFAVRRQGPEAELLVAEGRVRFGPGTDGDAVVVAARQQAVFDPRRHGVPQVTVLEAGALERRLAWQSGRLSFKDMPLAEVVAEFNRYHRLQLAVADPATGVWPFTGAFELDNVDAFVRLLDGIEVQRRDANAIVLRLKR